MNPISTEPHAGWLVRNDALPYEVNGVKFRTTDPTRREEYHWAADVVWNWLGTDGRDVGPIVLDAGCGFDPTIHLFPYMLVGQGARLVMAVDNNLEHLTMPGAPGIFRLMGDITSPPTAPAVVDVYTCISVIEHLDIPDRVWAFSAAFHMLRAGGLLVLTADEIDPIGLNGWAKAAGFEVGPVLPVESNLSPKVSYLVARKP